MITAFDIETAISEAREQLDPIHEEPAGGMLDYLKDTAEGYSRQTYGEIAYAYLAGVRDGAVPGAYSREDYSHANTLIVKMGINL